MEASKPHSILTDKKLRNQIFATIVVGIIITIATGFITSYEVSSKKAIENNLLLLQNCEKVKVHDEALEKKVDKTEFDKVILENTNAHTHISDKLDMILLRLPRK